MDLRSLRYFVETVRLNSFTQAAETLHVTQSTISKMVRQLEDEVVAPLLIRDGRKLTLTDTGAIVYARGQDLLATIAEMTLELRDTQALQRGSLTVGIPPMINLLFTPVLKAFRQRHPAIALTLREDTGQAIERQVAAGELEIGLTVLPADPLLALETEPIASYPIWAVVAQSGQWDWLVAMASAGMGVALLPQPFIHRLAIGHLDTLRLVEPELQWPVAHVWNGRYLSHAARAWLDVCHDVLGRRGA